MGLTRGSASLSKRPKSSTIYYLSAHVNHGKTNILQQHCKYSHNHCCRTNSVRVSSFIESSPHTTRHALHQCPHLYHPRCSPHLADSMTQFGKIERRTILVSDPEWHLIPYIFYPVHVWPITGQSMALTSCWPRNATVSHAICERELSGTNTKWSPRNWM